MTQLSEKILAEIEAKHIVPVPRWHFLLKNYVLWSLFGISVLLGSLAFSVITEIYRNGDWDMIGHLQGNLLTSAVMMLPYFWFSFLLLFALVAYYNWKHTKVGYRFARRWIFLGSIAGSIFLGSAFSALGWGGEVDKMMSAGVPFYDQTKHSAREIIWQQPDRGLLIGRIVEIDEAQNQLIIQDPQGKDWQVDELKVDPKLEAKIKAEKKRGRVIKIVGSKKDEKTFEAKEIRKCGNCDNDEDDLQNIDADHDGN